MDVFESNSKHCGLKFKNTICFTTNIYCREQLIGYYLNRLIRQSSNLFKFKFTKVKLNLSSAF